ALAQRATSGIEREIAGAGLAAHVVTAGAKGCVVFSAQPVRDYRGFLTLDDRYSQAHWLFQHNGGVFLPPWGKAEQWLISVQHDKSDIRRLVTNFGAFARPAAPWPDLARGGSSSGAFARTWLTDVQPGCTGRPGRG